MEIEEGADHGQQVAGEKRSEEQGGDHRSEAAVATAHAERYIARSASLPSAVIPVFERMDPFDH
jgi:hypothetical protein